MTSYRALTLENLIDEGVLGNIPQLKTFNSGNKWPFNYTKLYELNPFTEDMPTLSDFYLVEGAIPTDIVLGEFISLNAGLFVSEKMKGLLEKYNLGRHALYPVPVRQTNPEDQEEEEEIKTLSYFFFHLVQEEDSSIDYGKSIIVDEGDQDLILKILSAEDIEKEKDDFNLPLWKKVALTKDLDVFRLPNGTGIYISPGLAEEVERQGITGAKIAPDYYGLEVVTG